ncbi:hypothetical protein IAR55_004837 [Kwoniella newhampshirensis]|uniref:Protein YOP1 n=1 Tax=Kwoniella newhampshirensis TaxID=1651941 RepID=A0AAW0YUC0_9TREE
MIIGLISRWACSVCSFLYPAYASYKALSIHPDSSPEAMYQVERWLMYWAVVGTWTAVEAVVGWTFTWLPFYSLIKAGIFLYFSLPQSEGSTYIYRSHLAPLFNEHERDIDYFLASLRTRATSALAGGVGWLWEKVKAQLSVALPANAPQQGYPHQGVEGYPVQGVQQPPTLADPASGAIQQMYGLFSHYAGHYMPVAISALSAAASATRPLASGSRSRADPTTQGYRVAEQVPEQMSMPVPVPTPGVRTSESESTLRSRTYTHAQAQAQAQTSARFTSESQRSVSSPSGARSGIGGRRAPSSGSEESLGSRWSGGEMSGYEQIGREEVQDVPASPSPLNARPGMEKRTSSWWGWSGSGTRTPSDKSKVE